MSFRRSDDASLFGSRWRLENRNLLGVSGIPAEIADCDRRWGYTVLHGDDYPGTGWDVSWITAAQAANLLAVLERDLTDDVGCDLIRLLRQRVAARDDNAFGR